MKKFASLACAALAALSLHAAPSFAQAWPQRPVRFILPLGPGAGADISARLFADQLGKRWGRPVVVDNRPGGDGVIAINAVISARDDHILLWGPASTFVGLIAARSSGLSDAARERIAADIAAAVADPVIVERLTATAQIVSPGSAADFAASIEGQAAQLAAMAKLVGMKPKQ